jgi:branched-chain amino acid aminotransferase
VKYEEIKNFQECGLCGTAAVISPVGRIVNHDDVINLPSGMEKAGPVIGELYDTITGIQSGRIEGPEGWIRHIC